MKNKISWIAIALLCLIFLAACQAAPTEMPADFQITLERSPCFGTCPVYVLTVSADGSVEYKGDSFVLAEGRQTATVSAEEVAALYTAVRSADFFALEEGYAIEATDIPTATTTVTAEGRTMTISRYGGICGSDLDVAPESLCRVEALMESIATANGWVGEG